MGKKYTLDELTNVARTATLQALSEYTVPESMKIDLVAGVIFGDEHYVFELYVPKERPEDALIISRAFANRVTGEIDKVEITNLERKMEEKE